jgi:hypothetical protein
MNQKGYSADKVIELQTPNSDVMRAAKELSTGKTVSKPKIVNHPKTQHSTFADTKARRKMCQFHR